MFERFSKPTQSIVFAACHEAERLQHAAVDTEHLLLAFMQGRHARLQTTFKRLGISASEVRDEIYPFVKSHESVGDIGEAPFSDASREVFELAIEEATDLGHGVVHDEHLLLGLLRASNGRASQVLIHLGLNADKLRDQIKDSFRIRGSPTDSQRVRSLVESVKKKKNNYLAQLLEFMTDRTRVALSHSRDFSLGYDANEIGLEHLLLGLLRENGSAVKVIRSIGVAPGELEHAIEIELTAVKYQIVRGQMPFGELSTSAFEFSLAEAYAFGCDEIAPEHLLLGILRMRTTATAKALISYGLTLAAVRSAISREMNQPPSILLLLPPSVAERITDRVCKLLTASARHAKGLPSVSTEQLLLEILKNDDGSAIRVLRNLGIDTNLLCKKLVPEILAQIRDNTAPPPNELSSAAKQLFDYASEEAISLGHDYIGTEHLLLGMLRSPNEPAGRALAECGVYPRYARNEVITLSTASSSPPENISKHLEKVLAGQPLTRDDLMHLMGAIIDGRVPPASLAAIAVALRMKGETPEEMAALASVMRARCCQVEAPDGALDTCGTGGDKSGTFNVSTATAFVVAGMGIPVAKHGGKSVSSKTGSADVLKTLGVETECAADVVERCIKVAGIGFMFAPLFHPGMRHVAAVRKELGVRTVFNLLGPLSNPANAKLQLIGVHDPALCEKFASVLKLLGSQSAMVVCGQGPGGGTLDELSTFGPSHIAWLREGQIVSEDIDPKSLGLAAPADDALNADDAESSAKIIQSILDGEKGPARDIVVLNAAAAARVAGKAATWEEGIRLAAESIDTKRAQAALKKLVNVSNGRS